MTVERQRVRMLGRLRQYLTRRRSPRSVLSSILILTAISGFLSSMGMLKLGLGEMWLRYPLAVLVAWGVFLALVRAWAHREHEEVRVDEDLADLGPKDDVFDGAPGRRVLYDDTSPRRWWDGFDWLTALLEAESFIIGLAVLIAVIALAGAFVAIAGLILQAEVILAEVLLDVLLVSALNKRLHKLGPGWWLESAVRQTVGPVIAVLLFLGTSAFLMQKYAPEAESIGMVWKHWRGPQ